MLPESETVEERVVPMDSLSYALGSQIGQNLVEQGLVDISTKDLQKGIRDALNGVEPKMDDQAAIALIEKELQTSHQQLLETKKTSARLFLLNKSEDKGTVQCESGLLYEILWKGDIGMNPDTTDAVKVQMEGSLLNGKVFESTYKTGRAATLTLKDQLPGLIEGIQLMRPGAKYKFYLPPELAFGESGNGIIGAWEVLVYEVELIEVIHQ